MSEFDTLKHVAYWKDEAHRSWEEALYLVKGERILLANMNSFNIHGRYPEMAGKPSSVKQTCSRCSSLGKRRAGNCGGTPVWLRPWPDASLSWRLPRGQAGDCGMIKKLTHRDWAKLWVIAAPIDVCIEPIAVGEKQLEEDRSNLSLEVARCEGQIIPLAE